MIKEKERSHKLGNQTTGLVKMLTPLINFEGKKKRKYLFNST